MKSCNIAHGSKGLFSRGLHLKDWPLSSALPYRLLSFSPPSPTAGGLYEKI
jgi:hypothetical protein